MQQGESEEKKRLPVVRVLVQPFTQELCCYRILFFCERFFRFF